MPKRCILVAALGIEVGIAFSKRLGTGFFGGERSLLGRFSGMLNGN